MTNNIKVSSAGTKTIIGASTPQNYYDGLSKQWAISEEKVQGLDYSSKYYAEKSKEEFAKVQSEVTKAQGASNEAQSYANLANGIIEDGKTAITELEQQAEINIENKKDELSLELKNEKTTYLNEVKTASQTAINTYSNVLTKTQISNCLLEVPQNIKLELNDGTLTLKAGSTVIVPNGANNFERVTIASDLKRASFGTYEKADLYIQIYRPNSTGADSLSFARPEIVVCGATQPEVGKMWYDTTNNKIYNFNSTGIENAIRSLPFAIVAVENGVPVEIKQVFNGLGHFGNCLFRDKGIKGLIPNSRNTDGTLKNTAFTTTNVATVVDNTARENQEIVITATTIGVRSKLQYLEEENLNYNGITEKVEYSCPAGIFSKTQTQVTEFKPKETFRAVDYNDFKVVKEKQDEIKRYVVEKSDKSLLPSWYTVYNDGWIEQGGHIEGANNAMATVTLLKAYTNTQYTVTALSCWSRNYPDIDTCYYQKTTTSFQLMRDDYAGGGIDWYACGY